MKYFKPFEMPVEPVFPDYSVNITDFGAASGHSCTRAIREAIENCASHGGGRVIFPEGNWKTGAIHLKDNINLHFEEGCLVEFSTDFNDYLPVVYGILGGIRCYSVSHFLYAYRCKNIALTGSGILDGHGESWWHMKKHQPGMEDLMLAGKEGRPVEERVYNKPEHGVRPRMLQFAECENILIEGITMRNSPSWTVHPAWCKNIIIRNVTVRNPHNAPNTDGINLESCRRALIEGCDVSIGDDVICLKAGRDEDARAVGIPCEDVVIRNCVSADGHGGVTIGSETSACVRNAYIHNCKFGRLYSAIRIKTMKGRGGVVENIDYENITIQSATKEAIAITLRYDGEPLDDQSQPKINMPKVRNISIQNIKCEEAETGIDMLGEKGYELENIYISDVSINASVPLKAEDVLNLNLNGINLKTK